MINKIKQFFKDKKGFTLVELMVVVAILGILTMVAIPLFNKSTVKAEKTTCDANIRTIESAITQAIANGDIKSTTQAGSVKGIIYNASNPEQGYLKSWPQCPSQKTADDYTIGGTYPSYTVVCKKDTHASPAA